MQHFPNPASAWSQLPVGKYKYSNMYHICINKVQLPTKYTLFLLQDPPPPKKNIVDPKLG